MPQDTELVRSLCIWLWNQQSKPWIKQKNQYSDFYQAVSRTFFPFGNDREIDEHFKDGDIEFGHKFIYMSAIEIRTRVFIPVMKVKHLREKDKWSFYLVMLTPGGKPGEIQSIGFRYESPEGEGRHHCYHVQLVSNLFGGPGMPNCPGWLPDDDPTFPVDADNPVKLFLCMVISLCGVSVLYQRGFTIYKRELDDQLKKMRFSEFLPSYYVITSVKKPFAIKIKKDKVQAFVSLSKSKKVKHSEIPANRFFAEYRNNWQSFEQFRESHLT